MTIELADRRKRGGGSEGLDLIRSALGATPIIPGLLLTISIAGGAYALRTLPGVSTFSPMILAIILGVAFNNFIGVPAITKPGVTFGLRRVLRLAIIMLGLQLTTQQIVDVGLSGIALIVGTLFATFFVTKKLGTLLGVDRKLAELIAAGTSICGASAVIATNTVTQGSDEDVAYAVACVTVFGTISMFLYPVAGTLLQLDPHAYGLWAGSSIHEIAQVVAAAFAHGGDAGNFGTIAKLSRVILLAPLVFGLGIMVARRNRASQDHDAANTAKAPMPWFLVGFVVVLCLNSLALIPAGAKSVLVPLSTFLLTVALASMGLETNVRKLSAKGPLPLALGALSSAFISVLSLVLVLTFG